jgi:hypothetical protein
MKTLTVSVIAAVGIRCFADLSNAPVESSFGGNELPSVRVLPLATPTS